MAEKTVSIIGCGWLGIPLAERLLNTGYTVKGSTTSAEKLLLLRQKGIDTYLLQLNPEPVGNLSSLVQADVLIIDIPPKLSRLGNDFHPKQLDFILKAVRNSTVQHVIYISSTSVYPELKQVALEQDITTPEASAAPGLVMAEQLVQQLSSGQRTTVLRCGGLMGYDRIPGKYVAGKTVDSGAVPVNYLHRDDAIGVLLEIIAQQTGGIFNAVAPEHPAREAIYRKSCADFGYQLPSFIVPETAVPYKTVSVEKLKQAINYTFCYPDPLQFQYTL